jgi:hypothetical protein
LIPISQLNPQKHNYKFFVDNLIGPYQQKLLSDTLPSPAQQKSVLERDITFGDGRMDALSFL